MEIKSLQMELDKDIGQNHPRFRLALSRVLLLTIKKEERFFCECVLGLFALELQQPRSLKGRQEVMMRHSEGR